MKLNQDCIRYVMFELEKELKYPVPMNSSDIKQIDYDYEEIAYAVIKLIEANFLSGHNTTTHDGVGAIVTDITFNGHEFIGNISNESVWIKTKDKANQVGRVSLHILSQIAANILSKMIIG